MPDPRHDEINALIPWYVNETLQDTERQMVETHLTGCATCRQDVQGLRALAAVLQAEVPEPRVDLYARTAARLEQERVTGVMARIRELLTPVPRYALAAMAAQLVVIVALAGVILTARPYTTLSDQPGGGGPAAEFQVIFAPQATTSQMRSVLTTFNARIVDGPTSAGVYRVAIPLKPSGPTPDEILRRLRGSRGIEFAEIIIERR